MLLKVKIAKIPGISTKTLYGRLRSERGCRALFQVKSSKTLRRLEGVLTDFGGFALQKLEEIVCGYRRRFEK
ncbi:hypothetical protein [Archaeoglobus fulgidus]|uniref:hypothetical protein n=1 Tax=Archaeoglobus fulgidus TaxID=2234 RepID=UPI00064FDF8D|nr:hypothetical protein [Archaeoglobus fulgidus]